ncbi:MAG: TonB-dependent receptor domain-containing protein [Chitinispirillaceae bacterium]
MTSKIDKPSIAKILLFTVFFCLPCFSNSISGRVFDSADEMPLAGIQISVKDDSRLFHTDHNGSYIIDSVAQGDLVLVLKGSGYSETEIRIGMSSPHVKKDIFLERSTFSVSRKRRKPGEEKVIMGTITDSLTGEKLAGASVSVARWRLFGDPVPIEEQTVFTNRRGEFALSGINKRKKSIRLISDAGGYFSKSLKIQLPSDTTVLDISLLFRARQREKPSVSAGSSGIQGVVKDSLRGHGLSGVRLRVGDAVEYTDENGFFTFNNLKEGRHVIEAEMPEYVPYSSKEIRVGKNSTTEVTVNLISQNSREAFLAISGCVKDSSGAALTDGAVLLDGTSFRTTADSAGCFQLQSIPRGSYNLVITKNGYSPFVISNIESDTTLEVTLSNDTTDMADFRSKYAYEKKPELKGNLVDSDGFPIQGASIMENDSVLAKSGHDGAFTVGNLEQRTYNLQISAKGYQTPPTVSIDILPGENSSGPIVLSRSENARVKTGRIFGSVSDKATELPIAGTSVSVENTKVEVYTDLDGVYRISGLKPGFYKLVFQSRGYGTAQSEALQIEAGSTVRSDIALTEEDVEELERVVVAGTMSKNTGASLLKERQSALSFTDAIGGAEISRSGAGNAAEAMKTVTGATVVGSRYVYIRGLGEKYTITTLNGSPLPSPDPDKKAVNMDIFPSAMIENITVHKTSTSTLPGNWAGGIVDMRTKAFPEELTIRMGASGNINEATLSDKNLQYEGGKLDWLGFDDGSRAMPEGFENYSKIDLDSYQNYFALNFNSALYDQRMENGMRDTLELLSSLVNSFDTVMAPQMGGVPLNQSYSFSLGNTIRISDRPLGFYAGMYYSNKYDIVSGGTSKSYSLVARNPEPIVNTDLTENKGENTVLWGVLGNASYQLSEDHALSATYLYTRNAIDKASRYNGYYRYYMSDQIKGDTSHQFVSMRLHYIQRALNYVQPEGTHDFEFGSTPLQLNWTGSFTSTTQDEPNLRDIGYMKKSLGAGLGHDYQIQTNYPEPSHKFRLLDENALNLRSTLHIPFYQWNEDSSTVSLGGFYSQKARTTTERAFYYRARTYIKSDLDRTVPPEDYFSSQYRGLVEAETRTGQEWGITFRDDSQDPAQWSGTEYIFGGHTQLEMPLTGSLSTILGLRYERTDMYGACDIERYRDSTVAEMDYHDLLPSASLIYSLSENMKIRGAYGRTLVRPSMREKSEYLTESFTGGPKLFGNRQLERSTINNIDLRWEWFPQPGELLTTSAFFKQINKPIEMTFLINDIFKPANTDSSAIIYGLELEFRKNLDMISYLKHFQVSSNLTFAWSRIGLDDDTRRNPVYMPDEPLHRPFQGLSPYVININLTYDNPDIGTDFNLLYNHFGKRMSDLTPVDIPYLWEKPQHLLNLTYNQKFLDKFTFKTKVTNLLSLIDGINTDNVFVHDYYGEEYITRRDESLLTYSAGISYSF